MKLLAALLITLLHALPARADTCPDLRLLEAFITDQTGYSAAPTCQTVHRAKFISTDATLRSQAGGYAPETGRITLARDLDLETVLGKSYLLHELVHAAQYQHGAQTTARCPAALEAEAYAVQAAYLRHMGEPREALLLGFLASPLSQCPGESAPGY